MLFSFIPTTNAELCELVMDVNIQKGGIYPGETIIVTGKVINHAYNPVEGIEIFIRTD
ncbi:MAG: hypothetical protein ACRBB5_05590 [Nitrosopumilus sp.]